MDDELSLAPGTAIGDSKWPYAVTVQGVSELVTVQIPLELLRHLPMRIATRWGRCPLATTFLYGQRSECADLSELLRQNAGVPYCSKTAN